MFLIDNGVVYLYRVILYISSMLLILVALLPPPPPLLLTRTHPHIPPTVISFDTRTSHNCYWVNTILLSLMLWF